MALRMVLPSGTHLGSYEIVALLGAGGMGEVYRVRDSRLERAVALKIRPPRSRSIPMMSRPMAAGCFRLGLTGGGFGLCRAPRRLLDDRRSHEAT